MPTDVKEQIRRESETVAVRRTVPVNPLSGAIVIVELAVAPANAATLVGLAVIEKPIT